ncbi:bifunctional 23S rRNA (guanine(2069)-N(7))-methyltransferase RlmK/23S rRNA (guanine(2445)-N(2))-methyltransferase RlmL [Aerosticca soli]|uniref:Ribosomal RNA large subunit methyltransferase K/L n=1 Tax=Aerosticca soli TaxID=2010829 RepID=A0A2Z6E4Y5_9GAMM|nr:bifunctional 23S rRNA (guanine(2069)-N(7))-methyltransferase RlmK/23S rRNA (guanine(2445)-N(2))-methyltransferase RlmL [Aerosticca soli]BBD79608.1 23S rRNA -methyltransferase rlmL [Aerosticca soli]
MRRFFASCPKGLEYLLRDELLALGAAEAREALAGVHFSGTLETAYRACLWSRLASRILLPLTEFEAVDEAALYAGVEAVDWSEHLDARGTLAVEAHVAQSRLTHSQFAARRVKDAVVDQFRRHEGVRPDVDVEHPDLRLDLRLRRDRATLSIDLSGTPLHRRGWRRQQGAAPLKENLAAALLLRARWPQIHAEGGALLDPMCGSGTILIEAALMAADVAPGLQRAHAEPTGWRGHDAALWAGLVEEARQRAERGLAALRPVFFGSDDDPRALDIARANARAAGVEAALELTRGELAALRPPAGVDRGLVVTNPPYGERLGERAALPALYRTLGEVLRERFAGWHFAVLAGDAELAQALGLAAERRYTLYNGALETTLVIGDIRTRDTAPSPPRPLSAGAQMLKNRLDKTVRHLRRRLVREGIHAWRAYDRDLPDYAAAIDVYTTTAQVTWLHVQEYRAPADIPAAVAQRRLRELVRVAGDVFAVPRERIVVKTRERGKGGAKYGRLDQRGDHLEVEEGGLRFLVNLTDYLDTGLFLDHRLVRARLRELAAGRRFLNLFAYTATASVYAAAGGARDTTSVDLSATYLDWASRNLALNGFQGPRHRLVQADARRFLAQDRERYGLIYVDPPTFSNSKRAEDFDVQRDHAALLIACAEHLADDGVIVFSNNFRRFTLDAPALAAHFRIADWSRPSIPFDFARQAGIHGCWLLHRHGSAAMR